MSRESYDYLLSAIGPAIEKESTNMRDTLSAGERLSLTLRFLASVMEIHKYR